MVADADALTRDIPVAAPPPSAARGLHRTLAPRLSEAAAGRLSHRVLTDYYACLGDRAEWERRLVQWENAYYNKVEDKLFPWPGASNFHVPVTMMGVETYKPRLVEAVLGQTPPIMAVPTTGGSEERADTVETFLNWQVLTQMKLQPLIAESAHLFLQPGLVVAKTSWVTTRRRRRMIREFSADTALPDILNALFGAQPPTVLESDGPLRWTGVIPSTLAAGGALDVVLEQHFVEDDASGTVTLQVLLERDEVTEGPKVELLDPTDLIVPARGGADPQLLPHIAQRLWLTEDDLRHKARQGIFYADAVQTLLDSGPPRGDQPTMDSGAYRQSQDATEGLQGQGPSNARRWQFEVLESYRRYDIDDDGLEEEIIVWVAPHARGEILGWDYLDNVYAHGRRPLRVARFFPIPFRFYGLAFAEVVKGIQDELNAIHNQRVDYGTIQNLPFYWYRASSTQPPITQQIMPGQGIATDNPQTDVFMPKWQGDQAWGQQEEALLMQHFERLTGLNDLSLGRQPNRVGATRTAAGTQTLLSEAGLRAKGILTAFQQFWTGIFSDILALDQEYLPPRTEFRVTGKLPTAMQIKDRTELRGEYELRLAATSETMNRQRQREDATAILQALQNPIAMQGGLVGLKAMRRGYKDFLRAFGKDPDLYLEAQAPILTPAEELQRFNAGQYVAPVQGEPVQEHLAAHQMALADPVLRPEVRALLQRHLQDTQALIQQQLMMQMAQQQRPGGALGAQAVQGAQGAQGAPVVGQAPPAGNGATGAGPGAGMAPRG